MKQNLSRMLVGTVLKKSLTSIKDCPERGIRNLVDMALQFSDGRFQKHFFTVTQTMLQNENSAYYDLVRDTITHTNIDRLYTFGMNLGYNGCTEGARCIRINEKAMNCNIPWNISLQINSQNFEETITQYNTLIHEGENLGIYTWLVFPMNQPKRVLSLAETFSNSVFCIFCEADELSSAFLDEVADLYNVMLVIRYDENASTICDKLKEMGLLYSVWYQYNQKDIEFILNGDLFYVTQQLSPCFTVLIPEADCPDEICHLIHQASVQIRIDQSYRTLVWELYGDNCLIDAIISGDACSVYFDSSGDLYNRNKKIGGEHHNMFKSSLSDILINSYPKEMRSQHEE